MPSKCRAPASRILTSTRSRSQAFSLPNPAASGRYNQLSPTATLYSIPFLTTTQRSVAMSATNGTANGTTHAVPLLINGEEVQTDTTFDVVSPSSSQKLWHSSSASVSDAQKAVAAAVSAFPSWAKTKPSFRRSIFLRAADILDRRADELANYMMEETGALETFTKFNLTTSAEMLREVAGRISGVLGGSVPVCQAEGTSALVLKEPYGVVLGIAPW